MPQEYHDLPVVTQETMADKKCMVENCNCDSSVFYMAALCCKCPVVEARYNKIRGEIVFSCGSCREDFLVAKVAAY